MESISQVGKRKDGTAYTEDAVISPVKSSDGTITNYVAVKRDITQELIHEEQMQKAQKMEAVGQLAGGIAHKILPTWLIDSTAPYILCFGL